MKIFIGFFFFVFSFVLFSENAQACTCSDYGVPVCKLYQNADAVFVGKVERITSAVTEQNATATLNGVNSISTNKTILLRDGQKGSSSLDNNLIVVSFKVEQGFKGISGTTIKALTYKGTSCDLEVKTGERWIIYAYKDDETGNLSFGACGGNGRVEKDSDAIKELENISEGKSKMAVLGRIAQETYGEVKGAKVTLEGNGSNLTTYTDSEGRFKFAVSQPGIYKIKVSVPFSAALLRYREDQAITESPTETETIFEYEAKIESNSCNYNLLDVFKIDLKATAKINWRFSQNAGENFDVRLCRVKSTEQETLSSCSFFDQKNDDGSYEFGGLREGDFVLVVSKDDFPEFDSPFIKHYYPGVRNFSEAQIIKLEQGQQLNLPQFKLPTPLPTQEVKGNLFWKNGKPVTEADLTENGVYFEFYNPLKTTSSLSMSHYISPDEAEEDGLKFNRDGSFSFHAFTGANYFIRISAENRKGKKFFKELTVKAESSLEPLKIILDSQSKN